MLMSKDWIMRTMELAKKIMRRRDAIIRESQADAESEAEEVVIPRPLAVTFSGRPGMNPVDLCVNGSH